MNQQTASRIIHSDSYGVLEVAWDRIYRFPKGIVGFSEHVEYGLIHFEDAPFSILHAMDGQLSFILLPAHLAKQDYGFTIDQTAVQLLGISKPEEVATYVIVNIVDGELYVNLKAPILLAPASRNGCQYIVDDPELPLRYPLKTEGGG